MEYEKLRDKAIKETRKKIKKKLVRRDNLIVQAVKSIDVVDKTSNLLLEQLRNWYGIYFPELARKVDDPDEYLVLLTKLMKKENFKEKEIVDVVGKKKYVSDISRKAKGSLGIDLDELDLERVINFSKRIKALRDERKEIEAYLEALMHEEAPNLTAVIGSTTGARLISASGSLKRLAEFPSSTVQVIGAEKALFAHLHKKTKPPKHGIIFQYPKLRGAQFKLRGKIARKIAAKVSMAAKIDYFKGEFIGDKLAAKLDEEIGKIVKARK